MHLRGAASVFVVVLAATGLFATAGSARPTIDSTLAMETESPIDIARLMALSSRQARGPGPPTDVHAPRAPTGSGLEPQNFPGCYVFNRLSPPYMANGYACPWTSTGWIILNGQYWFIWYWFNITDEYSFNPPPYSYIGYQAYFYYWDGTATQYVGCLDYDANNVYRGLYCGRY